MVLIPKEIDKLSNLLSTTHEPEINLEHTINENELNLLSQQSQEQIKDQNWLIALPEYLRKNKTDNPFIIQNSLSLDDYPSYDSDSNNTINTDKHNQMLPIYCSLMGLIILSLLGYVIYKLWKQKEAMKSAKLTEIYGIHTNLDKNILIESNAINNTNANNSSMKLNKDILNCSTSQSTNEINKVNIFSQINYEHEPLLGNFNKSPNNSDQLLDTIPLNVMGILCCRLAECGWKDLVNLLNIDPTELKENHKIPTDLMNSSIEAQNSMEIHSRKLNNSQLNLPNIDDLQSTCLLIHNLCRKYRMSLNNFYLCLQSINRSDLIPLLKSTNMDTHIN